MGKIISSTNNKGGVGKTTMVINMASLLANDGYKVLLLDLDTQCNLTQFFGIKKSNKNIFDENSILQISNNIDIIPGSMSNINLYLDQVTNNSINFKSQIGNKIDKLNDIEEDNITDLKDNISTIKSYIGSFNLENDESKLLKEKLSILKSKYDYIFIDLPPSIGEFPEMAWASSDFLLIPISDSFALQGTELLISQIVNIKKKFNNNLKFVFYFNKAPIKRKLFFKEELFSNYTEIISTFISALNSNKDLMKESFVINDIIRYSQDLIEAQHSGNTVLSLKGKKIFDDYNSFKDSFIKIIN